MIIDPSFQGGEQHLGVQRWWLQRHNPVESQSGQRNLTLLPVFSGGFFFWRPKSWYNRSWKGCTWDLRCAKQQKLVSSGTMQIFHPRRAISKIASSVWRCTASPIGRWNNDNWNYNYQPCVQWRTGHLCQLHAWPVPVFMAFSLRSACVILFDTLKCLSRPAIPRTDQFCLFSFFSTVFQLFTLCLAFSRYCVAIHKIVCRISLCKQDRTHARYANLIPVLQHKFCGILELFRHYVAMPWSWHIPEFPVFSIGITHGDSERCWKVLWHAWEWITCASEFSSREAFLTVPFFLTVLFLAFHAFHLSKTTSTFHCLLMTSWCGCCSSYISYKKFKHKEYVLWRMIDFTHLTNCHKMNIQNTNYFLTCWVVRDSSCSKWSTCQCRWIFSGDRSGEIR